MDAIKINDKDNVAVALRDMKRSEVLSFAGKETVLGEDIKRGHKVALCNIEKGEAVIKYGYPVGYATQSIKSGEHVHIHNIRTGLGDDVEYRYEPVKEAKMQSFAESEEVTFNGFLRKDGRVGIRNELWIIPTVGCVNSVVRALEKKAQYLATENIEAVVSFNHPYGCSQMGDDQENTREALAALCRHPNAGGVLLVGLGCENSGIEIIKEHIGSLEGLNIEFLKCQEAEDETKEGLKLLEKLAREAQKYERTPQPASKLIVGMKCGGSDGLSGITANPAVGRFSDMLTGLGGSTILTEVPEMFGAETILMNRCENRETFEKTVKLIKDFKDYYRKNNQTIYENPSPGNKEGGISTLEDKALGCTQKSGSARVSDVLEYAQPLAKEGLNLLSAPGNDLVAATALVLSGAQLVLFTTGRGTPFASAVPTVKISSNSALNNKKSGWIDFDCGEVSDGKKTLDEISKELFEYVINVAGGKKVKSEEDGYRDLAIFKQGVTL